MEDVQNKFDYWLKTIDDQFLTHTCLVNISMLKIMRIYNIIADESFDTSDRVRRLVLEIHYLFFNDEQIFDMLLEETKV